MEENENLEQMTDQTDAFLEGWSDEEVTETESNQTEETAAEDVSDNTDEENTEGEESAESTEPTEDKAEPSIKSWDVKFMGENRTVTADEIDATFVQKGLNYDNLFDKHTKLKADYDVAKPAIDIINDLAKESGMTVDEYSDFLRVERKKASGMSEAEAKRAIDLEKREAAVSAKENEYKEAESTKATNDAAIQADLRNFELTFPDVYKQAKDDRNAIPESVWKDVNENKMTLTAAYTKYALAQAESRAKAAEEKATATMQNNKNASRSTGSMKSVGNDSKNRDAFLDAFM